MLTKNNSVPINSTESIKSMINTIVATYTNYVCNNKYAIYNDIILTVLKERHSIGIISTSS